MLECHRFEPRDADVHTAAGVTARQFELLAFRCSRADEHRVETSGIQEPPHAVDGRIELELRAHGDHIADFLVEHLRRQPEGRYVGAHQAAGDVELLEDRHVVAERQQIVGDGERGRARADAGDPLAIFLLRRTRQPRTDVVALIGGHPLQAADRHGFLLDAAAAAGGLARPVANAAQNPGKYIGGAVHHVSLGELALGDQSDVFGNIGVGRTGPLTINYLMKIISFPGVGRFHDSSS